MTATSSVLTIERDGNVGTLWLDNPDRRNALGPAFWDDLPVMMAELVEDDDVRVVVIAAREPKSALAPALGPPHRRPGIGGGGRVAELALRGGDITADRARDIALVNDVLPDHEALLKAAHELAAEIAANSPLVVQGTKAVLRAGEGRSVAEGLDYVGIWNAAFLQSNDLVEAMTAFAEKRPPHFTGD